MSDQTAVLLFVAIGSAILLGIAFWAEARAAKAVERHPRKVKVAQSSWVRR
jgi:uncharacterized membrane protein